MLRLKLGVSLLSALFLFTACSQQNTGLANKENNTSNQVSKAATDIEGILNGNAGKYAGANYDEEKLKIELKKIPKGATADQIYDQLISFLGEDYKNVNSKLLNFNTDYQLKQTTPKANEQKPENEKQLNVSIVIDSSGSMNAKIDGKPKMELAKIAVHRFVSQLPEGTNISMRVFGHKGSSASKDKNVSCSSSEVVYPSQLYEKSKFDQVLTQIKPVGYTPLALAIHSSQDDFQDKSGENNTNVIYVVSDGMETCGGKPVEEAKKLHQSNIKAVINIIGFNVGNSDQQALKSVAEAGGGEFTSVNTYDELDVYFSRMNAKLSLEWHQWSGNNRLDILQQRGNKYKDLRRIVNIEFRKPVNEENLRLRRAIEFLLDQKIVNSDSKNALENKIEDRKKQLDEYITAKDKQITDLFDNKWKNLNDEIERVEKEKQNELHKK